LRIKIVSDPKTLVSDPETLVSDPKTLVSDPKTHKVKESKEKKSKEKEMANSALLSILGNPLATYGEPFLICDIFVTFLKSLRGSKYHLITLSNK
tara:strand:- start:2240 stop:2524 length:285 start_codon:yes stop_codon:yes gene_type:complete